MDINNIIQNSTDALSTGGTISFGAIFLALSVSLVCGMFIAYIYRTQYQGVLFHQTHATAIVLITLVTTMVIMVISGNIVLSLGMVGAPTIPNDKTILPLITIITIVVTSVIKTIAVAWV